MFILNSFLLFDSNFFVTLQRHTLTQGMEYINCCNNMNQELIPMISVDKMITRTDPVIDRDGNGGKARASIVFASRFISMTCTLNGRKVPTWIL